MNISFVKSSRTSNILNKHVVGIKDYFALSLSFSLLSNAQKVKESILEIRK